MIWVRSLIVTTTSYRIGPGRQESRPKPAVIGGRGGLQVAGGGEGRGGAPDLGEELSHLAELLRGHPGGLGAQLAAEAPDGLGELGRRRRDRGEVVGDQRLPYGLVRLHD
jgi:hypothetical protein